MQTVVSWHQWLCLGHLLCYICVHNKTLYHLHRLVTNMIGCVLVIHMLQRLWYSYQVTLPSSFICLQMKTLCHTPQGRGTERERERERGREREREGERGRERRERVSAILHGLQPEMYPSTKRYTQFIIFMLFSVAIATKMASVSTVGTNSSM